MPVTEHEIRNYWEARSPGLAHSVYEVGTPAFFRDVERERYGSLLTYGYLKDVGEFDKHAGARVLEVGVGLGTDIVQFARNGSEVSGIDLTARAIELTTARFEQEELPGVFKRASFTEIPFDDATFDLVYSFGVLHHSPETERGIAEIHRVLKPGGRVIVMLYHKGFKYYIRKLFLYGVLRGEFLRRSAQEIVNRHSEAFGYSPLTKVYSRSQARALFLDFENVSLECRRLDDSFMLRGRQISITKSCLPPRAYRALENVAGWNLVIKGNKPIAEPGR